MKVVTAQEMARIEKKAIDAGLSQDKFMEQAGKKVAEAAFEFISSKSLPKKVLLLIGKGNNGGDAYAAGCFLLEKGFQVRAFPLYKEVSPLNKKWGELFVKKGGKLESKLILEPNELILDGFLGTGFKGKVEEKMALAIAAVNDSKNPILAIDIPSGLNGTTGEVETQAIMATETVSLGLPKIGFFVRQGWNHVGNLKVVDFGLPESFIQEAESTAYLPERIELPKIVRNRHKYQAGYVVGFGGSEDYSGASKLTGLAALRSGAGIVRLFSPEAIGDAPFELICNLWNEKEWKEALLKAQAVFIGPGLTKSKQTEKWLKTHLKQIKQHCVIDAGALLPNLPYPKNAILTPHRGEALRLLGLKVAVQEEALFAKVIRFCNTKQVVVVLKGAPTWVFAPKKAPIVIPHGDPGMATAGSGDVLTGIIAALLAQGMMAMSAAILGVTLHDFAGEAGAKEKTSYSLIASDLIQFLPEAFKRNLSDTL